MICKDNAPHAIVEKEGFSNFIKILSPLYKLPSRNTVRIKTCNLFYNLVNICMYYLVGYTYGVVSI